MRRGYLIGFLLLAMACGDDDNTPPDNSVAGDGDAPAPGDGDTTTPTTPTGDGDMATPGDGDMATGDGDMGTGDGDMGMMDDDAGMPPGDGDGDGYDRIAGGTFGPLAGYESSTATGSAVLAVSADGTEVSLQVNGLTADTTYPTHVHALPCALAGGGHYKLDPSVMDTVDTNELWPEVTTDSDGAALATLTSMHVARADAMAIVIHDPAASNAKMLCADLVTTGADTATLTGTFAAFADAESQDMSIMGNASLKRSATGTTVELDVQGLTSGTEYPSHVHALPCAVGNAGGHYKLDPSVTDTVETNELWPAITPDADGKAQGSVMNAHVARPDAQSVVIHRKTTTAAPKVACADLAAPATALMLKGDLMALQAATDKGLTTLAGSAELTRAVDGTAMVKINATGLTASTEYPTHLHNRPCEVADGGGHYKHDTSVSDVVEANEVWLTFTTDAAGAGSREVMLDAFPRADAQAIVIHDASDGARLACVPLK